jgi:glutamyl-Q tRNA(Asp) synthetase
MRGRFAPSPTGPLHFGSLFTAMASFADCKSKAGEWLVRIEDVDTVRCQTAHTDAILSCLRRLGFRWDGEVVHQSERTHLYADALVRLDQQGLTFRCICSRREIADSAVEGLDGPVYPGTCRHRGHRPNAVASVRFCTQSATADSFSDRIQGAQKQDVASEVGDFVLHRRDGCFSYQLACVVDDELQQITDVVRGADLLDSTARQRILQQALGFRAIRYAHVPVVCDQTGQKLSKQTLAPDIGAQDALETLLRAWAMLGQTALGLQANASPDDFWHAAVPRWQIESVPCQRKVTLV